MLKDEFGQAVTPSDLVLDIVNILENHAPDNDGATWLAIATEIVEAMEVLDYQP